MIITVDDLKKQANCDNLTDDVIITKLKAIETVIRTYTNNNFQQRSVRFLGRAEGKCLYGVPRFFSVGDTVQISGSGVNDGLYVVVNADTDRIEVDQPLMTDDFNLVTRINYPADVIQCAVDLFNWKRNRGDKVGIKSETLSRHSVTYEDSATLYMGYPVGILNGLKLYKKARC